MRRVLILGANGLLGQAMQKRFVPKHHVFAGSLEQNNFLTELDAFYIQVDLTSRAQVRELIIKADPEIIINAAAFTNVDLCEDEREKCWGGNVLAVENILEAPYLKKPIFVQISTDYVFDGETGAYSEIDKPNPRGDYARSKMAAENIVSASAFEYIIARTQVLYGNGKNIRPNFVTWLIHSLKEKKQVQVVNDQIGSPTYAADVAEAVHRLLDKQAYGLFHVSGPDSISRYDFALKIAEIFNLDSALIKEITSENLVQKAPRPMNSSFVIDKLYNNLSWQPQNVEQALAFLKTELEKGND